MSDIFIRPSTSARIKKAPEKAGIPVPFSYISSEDGTDENILILLHGLGTMFSRAAFFVDNAGVGDTHIPFSKLGRQLRLPQTAVLALRAPEQIPYLYEDAFQWYTSFDELGEVIVRPNPTSALEVLRKTVAHLIDVCGWPAHRIHLFGFAQGGSVAAEFGMAWWKDYLLERSSPSATTTRHSGLLGSIISISGPLLSYPILSQRNSTPVLVVHNLPPSETVLPPGAIANLKKAFENVTEKTSRETSMPSSREGWEPIMQFWSTHLGRRQMDGLYEIMDGATPSPI